MRNVGASILALDLLPFLAVTFYFGNRQNNGADFRLWLNTGVTRYIDTAPVSNSSL